MLKSRKSRKRKRKRNTEWMNTLSATIPKEILKEALARRKLKGIPLETPPPAKRLPTVVEPPVKAPDKALKQTVAIFFLVLTGLLAFVSTYRICGPRDIGNAALVSAAYTGLINLGKRVFNYQD